MRLPYVESPAGLDVALCGIPFDGGCSYRSGARMGPRHVREQSSLIRPWNSALRVHPFERLRVADCGDVDAVPVSIEATFVLGIGDHRSWISPRMLPPGSAKVATSRPPPGGIVGSF